MLMVRFILPGVGGVEPLDVDLALVSPTFDEELLLLENRFKIIEYHRTKC